MRILVVEDAPERVKKFKRATIGHVTEFASSADEAIRLVEEQKFDLVFLDHDLGDPESEEISVADTGYTVAKVMCGGPNELAHVIIHSCNPIGANNMKTLLPHAQIIPFVNLNIVAEINARI